MKLHQTHHGNSPFRFVLTSFAMEKRTAGRALKRPAVPFATKKGNNKNLPEHIIAIEAVCLPCLQSLNLCTKYLVDSCWAHGELLGLTWGGRLCLRAVEKYIGSCSLLEPPVNARQSHQTCFSKNSAIEKGKNQILQSSEFYGEIPTKTSATAKALFCLGGRPSIFGPCLARCSSPTLKLIHKMKQMTCLYTKKDLYKPIMFLEMMQKHINLASQKWQVVVIKKFSTQPEFQVRTIKRTISWRGRNRKKKRLVDWSLVD